MTIQTFSDPGGWVPDHRPSLDRPGVHVYVDLSNLIAGARATACELGEDPRDVRIEASHLRTLLAACRPVLSATVLANTGVPEPVVNHFRRWFPNVHRADIGRTSGREEGGDEKLQLDLAYRVLSPGPAGTVVLATGDGAGFGRGRGFIPSLVIARRAGHGIEVASFPQALNPRLRSVAVKSGVLVDLDRHYRSITFLARGQRFAEPVRLTHRPTADPSPLEPGELDWLIGDEGRPS
ncbi:MAG TPA: hypothetical protein VGK17_05835 [Propionicimonas sp.]